MTNLVDLRTAFAATLVPPSTTGLTATGTGSGVDVSTTTGPLVADIVVGAVTGTTPSAVYKLQQSPDNSTFTDVPNAASAAVTATGAVQIFTAAVTQQYVRLAYTITGTTPVFPTSARLFAQPKISGTGGGYSVSPQT